MESEFKVDRYSSIREVPREVWEGNEDLYLGMKYDCLLAIEKSRVNQLEHRYLRIYQPDKELARANLYLTNSDFSTFGSKLANVRAPIKQWYPEFMNFKTLECGYFIMLGEGLIPMGNHSQAEVLPLVAEEMDNIAGESKVDILLFRDVPLQKYDQYKDILQAYGYIPVLGFANTGMNIPWNSMDEYLAALQSGYRYHIKKSLQFQENFGIDYQFTSAYQELVPELTKLWFNVHSRSKYYKREFLDERFYQVMADELSQYSEALVFKKNGKLVAFSLCMYDASRYLAVFWGVDYEFAGYQQSNIYRAANLLCLKRAIELGKKAVEFEVTNYGSKLYIGARAIPLIYFIKSRIKKQYSRALADIITENIKQPDNNQFSPFKDESLNNTIDFTALAKKIKRDRNELPSNDIFHKVYNFHKPDVARVIGIYNLYPEFKSAQQSSVIIGENQKVVLLGTNSYLGAANHPEVKKAAMEAIDRYGTGCSGSPALNGTLDIHNLLERDLAEFLGREAVVLCSTGYQTNLAGITALCKPGDLIIMDERSHRSLFDAAKLSGADYLVYRHNDMAHLEKMLAFYRDRSKIIVTDSVFSMEGTMVDLRAICDLAKKYGARLFVDEAHGIGIFGQNGRGVCELLGVEQDVDLLMCTFSKSFASVGGMIAGKKDLIDLIKHTASPHMFSAGLPPANIATVRAVLKIIHEEPKLRKSILEKAKYMADSLRQMGYDARYCNTQIVPVVFGDETLTLVAYKKFMEDGVYVNPVLPPAVPEKDSGFRTSYIATLEWEDLRFALQVFDKHKHILNSIPKEW